MIANGEIQFVRLPFFPECFQDNIEAKNIRIKSLAYRIFVCKNCNVMDGFYVHCLCFGFDFKIFHVGQFTLYIKHVLGDHGFQAPKQVHVTGSNF